MVKNTSVGWGNDDNQRYHDNNRQVCFGFVFCILRRSVNFQSVINLSLTDFQLRVYSKGPVKTGFSTTGHKRPEQFMTKLIECSS